MSSRETTCLHPSAEGSGPAVSCSESSLQGDRLHFILLFSSLSSSTKPHLHTESMRFQHSQEGKFRAPLPPQGLNLNEDSLIIKYLPKTLFCGISPFKKGTINQPTNVPILKRNNGCNIQMEQLLGLSQRLLSTTAATLQPGSSERSGGAEGLLLHQVCPTHHHSVASGQGSNNEPEERVDSFCKGSTSTLSSQGFHKDPSYWSKPLPAIPLAG